MQKEWSSYRITLLLYLIVFILPFSTFFTHQAFDTMRNDTKVVRQVSWIEGAVQHTAVIPSSVDNSAIIEDINDAFKDISKWVEYNGDSDLYIGWRSIADDYTDGLSCWTAYKQLLIHKKERSAIQQKSLVCWKNIENLAVIIEKMVYLKQKNIVYILYVSSAVTILLALLLIYFVRVYIHTQIQKNAIYDTSTALFNKRYFLTSLTNTMARSRRYKYPLSMIFISIDNFDANDGSYDKKTREHVLKAFGGLIISFTRESDIACRFEENVFAIILPDTEHENSRILEERIDQGLAKHDFAVTPKLEFKSATAGFDYEETQEAFIERTKSLLEKVE